eukprot:371658-Rhodomonas_salina.2
MSRMVLQFTLQSKRMFCHPVRNSPSPLRSSGRTPHVVQAFAMGCAVLTCVMALSGAKSCQEISPPSCTSAMRIRQVFIQFATQWIVAIW